LKNFFQKGVDKRRPFCYNIIRSGEEPEGHWDPRRTCLSFLKVKESQTCRPGPHFSTLKHESNWTGPGTALAY